VPASPSPEARPTEPARRRLATSARSLTHRQIALAIRAPRRLAASSAQRAADPRPPLVIGCGALARELVALTRRAGFPEVQLTCLPASLHNRPQRIPAAVQARIRRARADGYDRIFVAYADCGTGGQLDRVLEAEGVARLEGAHCYEVYAGRAAFAALSEEEPGTFYLTDFLARNFDRLVVRGLGLDRHPELLPLYFGNYRRLVFLAQTDDDGLTRVAQAAAVRLGVEFQRRFVGLGEMTPAIRRFAGGDGPGLAAEASKPAPATPEPASTAPTLRGAQEKPRSRLDGPQGRRQTQGSAPPRMSRRSYLRLAHLPRPSLRLPQEIGVRGPDPRDVDVRGRPAADEVSATTGATVSHAGDTSAATAVAA
jgi:hypothetical protein